MCSIILPLHIITETQMRVQVDDPCQIEGICGEACFPTCERVEASTAQCTAHCNYINDKQVCVRFGGADEVECVYVFQRDIKIDNIMTIHNLK